MTTPQNNDSCMDQEVQEKNQIKGEERNVLLSMVLPLQTKSHLVQRLSKKLSC